MAFTRGTLTDKQRKLIEANRQKAKERLQRKRGEAITPTTNPPQPPPSTRVESTRTLNQIVNSPVKISSAFVEISEDGSLKRARTEDEKRNKVEQNRLRAIEIRQRIEQEQKQQQQQQQTITEGHSSDVQDSIRLNKNSQEPTSFKRKFEPPPIRMQDYIEFDFSTMKDSRGGFISDDPKQPTPDQQSLDEWKEKQKELQQIRELPPPIDIQNAPRCYECDSIDIDANLMTNFQVRACRKCVKAHPEKYSLLTKTECREDYLLTEPELKDVSLLPRIEKPNPHGYSRMQLFIRFQVEEFAWKKWGGAQQLDEEWERREQQRIKRRDKKYQDSLREMRKKTRAEEYTRKLRNGQGLGERHVHDWSAPVSIGDNLVKRRCIDCGIETEEVII
ncbi:DNA repair protein RAD14 [Spathaspora sp. JA1]|nr:DNA repair protein RAD14 [Spathaspora sp. JA1]